MSSGTTAEPIQPDAPVTKTRMRRPPVVDALGTECVRDTSMSVAVMSIAGDVSHCHQRRSEHGSMGQDVFADRPASPYRWHMPLAKTRSEERRVGKECRS